MDAMHNAKPGSNRRELTAPCKGCHREIKKPGCHDHCGDYAEFREINEQKRQYEKQHSNNVLYDPLAPKRRRDF